MDGLGFIATLHATTLSNDASPPALLLKPKPARRSSNASTFTRAKSLVSRSRGIFTSSSSTITAGRDSTSSLRSTSSRGSSSTFTSPASSRLPSQDRVRQGAGCRSPLPSPPLSPGGFAEHAGGGVVVRVVQVEKRFSAEWYAWFVDRGYVFVSDGEGCAGIEDGCAGCCGEEEEEEDGEPSRASSTFERSWDVQERETGLGRTTSKLPPPMLDLATTVDADPDRIWRTQCQTLHPSPVPRHTPLPPPPRPLRARPTSTAI